MLRELVAQSWANLRRNPTRSVLTMLGIVWGIVAVAVLMAYGSGFRVVMSRGFDHVFPWAADESMKTRSFSRLNGSQTMPVS